MADASVCGPATTEGGNVLFYGFGDSSPACYNIGIGDVCVLIGMQSLAPQKPVVNA